MVINKPKSMFIETHMLQSQQKNDNIWKQGVVFDDTSFNMKYDEIVDKKRLQGISQHQKISIGDDFEYSVVHEDKIKNTGSTKGSAELITFNNVMYQ